MPAPRRAAVTAVGVVAFLFLFRPFGLEIDSLAEILVLLGVAPVSFGLMLALHASPIHSPMWQRVSAAGVLVIGITFYLSIWSQPSRIPEIGVATALVVAVAGLIVHLWNRGRIPEQEIDHSSAHADSLAESVVLLGDGEQEILRLSPHELMFMEASGNYVNVHYLSESRPARALLRSSLSRLAAQVSGLPMVQCHRSYFVNMTAARRIVRDKGRTLIEFDSGERVPVSRKYKQQILDVILA